MAPVFKIAEGVPCRACGAVRAPAHNNSFKLCDNCWTSLCLFAGVGFDSEHRRWNGERLTDADLDQWLCNKLIKDLKRLKRNGVVGRCEAITSWAYGNNGTQCGRVATQVRDEHKVCRSHALSLTNVYVDERTSDQYEMLRDVLSDLAKADGRFAQIIRELAA